MILFLGTSSPSGSEVITSGENRYEGLSKSERLELELHDLRINNNATLKYIQFKAKYGDADGYYKTIGVKE